MFATHIRRDSGVKENYQSHKIRQALAIIGISTIVQWPICGAPVAIGLTLLLAAIAIAWASPEARPLGVLLFWPMVINFICHPFGIYGGGFFLLIPLAGLLLIPVWPSVCTSWRTIPHMVRLSGLCLISWWFVSWMAGPRTDWGTLKFFASVSRLIIGVFALSACMRGKRYTFLEVGVIGLTAGSFFFAVNCLNSPISSFSLGVWKALDAEAEAVVCPRAMGMAIMIQFLYAIILCKRYFLALVGLTLACAVPMTLASDSRQVLLGIPLALLCLLVQKHVRLRVLVLLCFIVVVIGALFAYGWITNHYRYTIFFDNTKSFGERTWRGAVWDTGIDTWRKSPLFGVGLGGYGEDSEHFDRAFPHNLFIEILAETGFVGFLLCIIFLVACFAAILNRWPMASNMIFWSLLFPLWVYCLAISMVSQDIPANIEVLYFPVATAICMKASSKSNWNDVTVFSDMLL